MGGLWADGDGNRRDQVGERGTEVESTGRDDWNWGAFGGDNGNLVQWKLPGNYEGDPGEDS